MIAKHTFMLHAVCPFVEHLQYDYYDCTIQTNTVIDVHEIEATLNNLRGVELSQEDLCCKISQSFQGCEVTLTGRHNQNSSTAVTCLTTMIPTDWKGDPEYVAR